MTRTIGLSLAAIVFSWAISVAGTAQAVFTDDASTKVLLHLDDAPHTLGSWLLNEDDNSVHAPTANHLLLDFPDIADPNAPMWTPTWFSNIGPDGSGALQFKGPNGLALDPARNGDTAYLPGAWSGDISSLSLDVSVNMQELPVPVDELGDPLDNRMTIIRALDWQLHYRSNLGATDGFFELRLEDAGGGTVINSQTVPGINTWQDVNVQIADGTASLRVGNVRTTVPLAGAFNQTATQIAVGYDFFSGRHLKGVLDEIRVANDPAPRAAAGNNLFSDTFDGSDIQDSTGQSGYFAPLGYATAVPAVGSLTESAGMITIDGFDTGGAVEFSPGENFNLSEIEAAGGFIVEMTDVNPIDISAGAPGNEGDTNPWVGATLFSTSDKGGNPVNPDGTVYSFLFRDNGETVAIRDFFGTTQEVTSVPNVANAGGTHDIRLEVSITDFAASGNATIEAYIDDVLEQTTTLTGLDLSNNHIFFRGVDGISTIGGISIRLMGDLLAGDYNEDGIVNAADYTKWLDNVGAVAGTLPNDTDGGVIGQAQYDTWKANFGNTPGTGTATGDAIPEPAAIGLMLLGLGSLAATRRRRKGDV